MLRNILNAATSWWLDGEQISWLENIDTKYLWYAVIGIAALFLLIMIVLFFKAIKRTKQRKEQRRIAEEIAEAERAEKKAAKQAAKEEARRKRKEKPVKRVLTGITLDVGVVQRNFVVGDEFDCEGLLVTASYNVEPLTETLADYKLVKERVFEKAEVGKLDGLYVCKPDMKKAGKRTIRVCYNEQVAMYTISVSEKSAEKPIEEPVVAVVEEQPKESARVVSGISLDVGVVQRDFKVDDAFNCDGLLVNATFNLAPLQETLANYTIVDVGTFDQAVNGTLSGLYVCRPDMSKSGKIAVRVCFNKQVALYTISVTEKPVEEPKQPEVVVVEVPKAEEKGPERVVTGITLDATVVTREFKVGDEFNCDGLLVNAAYNMAPLQETLDSFSVVDQVTFDKAVKGEIAGLYVCRPDLTRSGKLAVRVCYNRQLALYTISVAEKPVVVVEPQAVAATAQPQQSTGPREMISLTVNTDFVRRDFYVGDSLVHDGLIVNAHYNREPFKEQVSNYTVIAPDMSKAGTPTVVVMFQDRATSYTVNVRENIYKQKEKEAAVEAEQPKAVREMLSVTLDVGVVQREFEVGEEFNCDGLLVNGNFSLAPTVETHADYNIVDMRTFDQLVHQSNGCFVCEPDMSTAGRKVVRVSLNKQIAIYSISVRKATEVAPQPAQPTPQPQPVVEEPKKVEREITSVALDLGVVQREFEVGEEFNCDGLFVNASYNLAPMIESYADFNLVDVATFEQVLHAEVSGVYVCRADTSTAGKKVVRVCLNKRVTLYTIAVKEKKIEPEVEPQPEPQPQPQVVVVEQQVTPPVAAQPVDETPFIIEEESYEAKLRYDKSFVARLIQSDDEIKQWYTQLKNKLLSFKGCKGRVSWKRETFKANKQVVAMLAFRGNTLCLFLPLSAADYEDTKYELEDVSNVPVYKETPAMMRLKNFKRVRLALELIEFVMDERDVPLDKKFVSEDYYMPYEGIVELIEKGLVKREIKTAADEAVFGSAQADDDGEDDSAVLTEVSRGVYVTQKKTRK